MSSTVLKLHPLSLTDYVCLLLASADRLQEVGDLIAREQYFCFNAFAPR